LWNIREAAIGVESAQTVMIICYCFALFHDYCDFFAIILIIPQPIIAIIKKINYSIDCKAKMAIWDGIHC
jgi:hypothetical protein